MTAIMLKELRTYFTQMMGYIILAFTVLITAIFFVMNVFMRSPNFHQVLSSTAFLFIFIVPIITMRLFAEEVKNKTDQLLYTSPLSIWQIVLGKYLAASILFLIAMVVTMIFPIILSNYGELPISQIIGAYVGYILIGLQFIAVGLFISVLSENQIIAAIITLAIIGSLAIIDFLAMFMPVEATTSLIFVVVMICVVAVIFYVNTKSKITAIAFAVIGNVITIVLYLVNNLMFDGIIGRSFRWLSVFSRFENLTRGILNLSDIVFYITFALVFIYLTVNVIEKRRWR